MKNLFMRTLKITSSMIIFTVAFFCFSICCCCIGMMTDNTQESTKEEINYDEELAEIKEQYEQQIAELNSVIETKDEQINNLQETISSLKEEQYCDNEEVDNLKQQMDEQNEIIFDKQAEIYELREIIANKNSEIEELKQQEPEVIVKEVVVEKPSYNESSSYTYNDDNEETGYRYQGNYDDIETSEDGDYYTARGNSYYHNSPNCEFLEGADTDRTTKEEAESNGKHECNCIKYGY